MARRCGGLVWLVVGLVAGCGGGGSTPPAPDGAGMIDAGGPGPDAAAAPDAAPPDAAPPDATPACGNGVFEFGEDCDDGNPDNTDDCLDTCVAASCGDGFLHAVLEECDDGAGNSDTAPDACRTDCTDARCGDGVTDTGEGCDDGNTIDTDGCRNSCALPTCGDGITDPGEDCDDANPDNTDACLDTCVAASCGDGFVFAGTEECDGGAPQACVTTCGTAGGQACLATCVYDTFCTPPAESCNGADDDCDGADDNGFACTQGLPTVCMTTCGSAGSGTCTVSCDLPTGAACTPPPEVCNGLDDDCVGGADDTFTCAAGSTVGCTSTCGTAGTGTCTAACDIPGPALCTPPTEACNGLDDDCDGAPDNGFACVQGLPTACTTTCGTGGTGACTASCDLPTGAACSPPGESCNGIDDDCDASCDDGFACCQGSTVACTTTCGSTGSGACDPACDIPSGAACNPPLETCNGADDDCDAVCDDGFPCCAGTPVACTTTCGTTGTGICEPACGIPSGAACTPPSEICNAMDEDCVGGADNGFTCVFGSTQPCTVGLCTGTQACVGPSCSWGACDFGSTPPNENCAGASITNVSAGGSFTGSTCASINDYTASCGSGAASADVVFRLDLAVRSYVVLDTVGSNFDAVLHLHQNATCDGSSGTEIACDDNAAGGSPGQARIANAFDPGTYWIVLDGAGAGSRGDYVFNVFTTPAPANDLCAGAIDVSAGGTFSGSTLFSAHNHTPTCFFTSAPDVYYTFTLAAQTLVYLDLQDGGAWNTVLQVRSGTCTGASSGCNNDACGTPRSQFHGVLGAGTYYVIVEGTSMTEWGVFDLFVDFAPTAGCTGATEAMIAAPTNATYFVTTSCAGCTNDHQPSCVAAAADSLDRTLYIPACGPRTVTITSCNGLANSLDETILHLRLDSCAAADLTCNDDDPACANPNRSTITADIPHGLSFFFVDGNGDTGTSNVTVSGL